MRQLARLALRSAPVPCKDLRARERRCYGRVSFGLNCGAEAPRDARTASQRNRGHDALQLLARAESEVTRNEIFRKDLQTLCADVSAYLL